MRRGDPHPPSHRGPQMIHTGDCLDVLPTLEAGSVDAVVCDPPYGIGFMGKDWDNAARMASIPPSVAIRNSNGREDRLGNYPGGKGQAAVRFDGHAFQDWSYRWATEALRVAKPGAYLLAFGGTRTVHRMTCAIEDAGWVIRDVLVWGYASGFPKSRASLKPAYEPIVLARKPGASSPLQIDAARIMSGPSRGGATTASPTPLGFVNDDGWEGHGARPVDRDLDAGRWPANVVLTDPIFDGDVPGVVGGGESGPMPGSYRHADGQWETTSYPGSPPGSWHSGYGDTGTYSRFFLVPKADRAEREPVLPSLVPRDDDVDGSFGLDGPRPHTPADYVYQRKPRVNGHPTVKPLDLMRHLVRLVTPPGGTCLDPFLGSGTTALACEMEGFPWIGVEREPEYVAIAEARLLGTQRGMGLDVPAPTVEWKNYPTAVRYPVKGPSQSSWFTDSTRDEETA